MILGINKNTSVRSLAANAGVGITVATSMICFPDMGDMPGHC